MAGFLKILKVIFLGIVEGITEWLPICCWSMNSSI